MKRIKQHAIGLSLALVTAACSSAPASNGTVSSVSNSNQDGPVTQVGPSGAGSGQRSAGASYSRAFANCVRAHGLPDFPAAGASITSLGAYLGRARFQADVNGPCRSLAPAAWVAAGQVGQNP